MNDVWVAVDPPNVLRLPVPVADDSLARLACEPVTNFGGGIVEPCRTLMGVEVNGGIVRGRPQVALVMIPTEPWWCRIKSPHLVRTRRDSHEFGEKVSEQEGRVGAGLQLLSTGHESLRGHGLVVDHDGTGERLGTGEAPFP